MSFGFVYHSADYTLRLSTCVTFIRMIRMVHFDLNVIKANVDIQQLLRLASAQERIPDLIVCEPGSPGLPRGLDTVKFRRLAWILTHSVGRRFVWGGRSCSTTYSLGIAPTYLFGQQGILESLLYLMLWIRDCSITMTVGVKGIGM